MNDAAAINRFTPAINRLEENRLVDELVNYLIDSSIMFSMDHFLVALIMSSDVTVIMRKVGLIGSI